MYVLYMLNTYMTVSVTIPITIVTIMIIIVNKVVLQVFAVEIGARGCLCHPMYDVSVIVSCSMLTAYMTVSVTIPVTILTIMIIIVTIVTILTIMIIIVNKVVLQVFAVEIGA